MYVIRERMNLYATGGCTVKRDYKSLSTAKRAASRMQVFQRSVLVIENTDGEMLAYKEDGHWHNTCIDRY